MNNAKIIVPRNIFFMCHSPLLWAFFCSPCFEERATFLVDKFMVVILLDASDPRKLTGKLSREPARR